MPAHHVQRPGEPGRRHPDRIVADLAGRQHGRVARTQLLDHGLTSGWIKGHVASGHLIVERPGIYVVGHRTVSVVGTFAGAVLACGYDALLSGKSTLQGLRVIPYAAGAVHATVPPGVHRRRRGLCIHHATIVPDERTRIRGIPSMSCQRALLDSAQALTRRQLERACDEAAYLRLLSPTRAARLLEAHRGHRGARLLRDVLREHDPGSTRTVSELEEQLLALSDAAGFRRPVVNRRTHTSGDLPRLDFVWFDARLIVETDGRAGHDIVTVERRDAERDRAAGVAGFRVLRFTWWDVTRDGARVTATLRPLLEAAAGPARWRTCRVPLTAARDADRA